MITWLNCNSEDELIEAYQSSSYCVIPYTDYPGCFPVTMAMANETPVIVCDSMGLPEYVNGSGLVVKSKSVQGLVDALRSFYNNESLRRKMGQQGRVIAENRFSWEVLAKENIQIYDTILRT